MESQKPIVCLCEKCGNEADMTVKCEEVVLVPGKPAIPRAEQLKRTVVCSRCGNEAEMIVDYAGS